MPPVFSLAYVIGPPVSNLFSSKICRRAARHCIKIEKKAKIGRQHTPISDITQNIGPPISDITQIYFEGIGSSNFSGIYHHLGCVWLVDGWFGDGATPFLLVFG